MINLKLDTTTQQIVDRWITAKNNEKGWNAVRKEAEAELIASFSGNIEDIREDVRGSTSLTTTVTFVGVDGKPLLTTSVGEELKLDQVGTIQFLEKYPNLEGVVCKAEMKPITAAILNKLQLEDELAKDLFNICQFKDKTLSFSAK